MSYLPELRSSLVRAAHRQRESASHDQSGDGVVAGRRGRARAWLGAIPVLLGVAVTVAIAAAALIAIRPGHSTPATSAAGKTPMSSVAAVTRGARPPAPAAHMALPILGSSGTLSLADYRGKVVVLNVFASWCELCRAQAAVLERTERRIADRAATVLGVTYEDDSISSEAFVRTAHITYPVLSDLNGRFVRAFGATGVPETFVIDRSGDIAAVRRYPASNRWLQATLRPLLAEPNGPASPTIDPAVAAQLSVFRRARTSADTLPTAFRAELRSVFGAARPDAAEARRVTASDGQTAYLMPASGGVCVINANEAICSSAATLPGATVADLCSPGLPKGQLEIEWLLPDSARNVRVGMANGAARTFAPDLNVYIASFPISGPVPKTIEWDVGGQHYTGSTSVPSDVQSENCAHPNHLASQRPSTSPVLIGPRPRVNQVTPKSG
jgi:cytochrome c biogenesis protein CcmG/thiol:disulfide interchange protein DsbE